MKHRDSIAARCPVCGKGRVIDIGPKANAGNSFFAAQEVSARLY